MTIQIDLGPRVGAGTVPPPPPPPTSTLPRLLTHGIMIRGRERANARNLPLLAAGAGGSTILELDWRSLQPTSAGSLNETAVLALVGDLDWAQGLNLPAMVRVFAGYFAPDWARAAAGGPAAGGGMTWYTSDGPLAAGAPAPSSAAWKMMPRPMPRWWDAGYQASYLSFITALAAETRIMGHPALAGVSMSAPMTQYAEPCVKQFSLIENRQSAVAAGYVQQLDYDAYIDGFQTHADLFNPLRVATYCAFNDYQQISPSGGMQVVPATTIALMEAMVTILGQHAVLENNSVRFPSTFYPSMYQRQRDFRAAVPPSPLHYQTATIPKHEAMWDLQPLAGKQSSPFATMNMVASWGAQSVEMASGCENDSVVQAIDNSPTSPTGAVRWLGLTVAQAADLNNRLTANGVGMSGP